MPGSKSRRSRPSRQGSHSHATFRRRHPSSPSFDVRRFGPVARCRRFDPHERHRGFRIAAYWTSLMP